MQIAWSRFGRDPVVIQNEGFFKRNLKLWIRAVLPTIVRAIRYPRDYASILFVFTKEMPNVVQEWVRDHLVTKEDLENTTDGKGQTALAYAKEHAVDLYELVMSQT